MGKEDMARMLVVLMEAGDVPALDLRDARDAHLALMFVAASPKGDSVCEHLYTTVTARPDPHVGLRVCGLTQALWVAVGLDLLQPMHGSVVTLTEHARHLSKGLLDGLPEDESAVVREAGQRWARRSTSRNTRASAFPSSAGK